VPDLNDHIEWLVRSALRMQEAQRTLKKADLIKFLKVGAKTHLERAQELVNHLEGDRQN
jgi:hypothetical protein